MELKKINGEVTIRPTLNVTWLSSACHTGSVAFQFCVTKDSGVVCQMCTKGFGYISWYK